MHKKTLAILALTSFASSSIIAQKHMEEYDYQVPKQRDDEHKRKQA